MGTGRPRRATIAAGAERAQAAASRWRMERTERPDGVTVINDAYNANPESMRAALRTLAELGRGRRTWAVLGEMLELGDGLGPRARCGGHPGGPAEHFAA